MLPIAALFATAILFGGMTLYSFGFAAFLFTALPIDIARLTIRKAFPHFYLFVMIMAVLAAGLIGSRDLYSAGVMAGVAATTVPARQILMPAINQATDMGNKKRFNRLHGLSVVVTLLHLVATGWVLTRFL
ncbi:MAG: DUF4149 domain-containing protein [Betaproteobacteria bacterium]|jgi:hypothetical protein|nr:DUF4149 domain-containing protein [Betaproteobacteria bacterium]